MTELTSFRTCHQGNYIVVKNTHFESGYLCIVTRSLLGDDDRVVLKRYDGKGKSTQNFSFELSAKLDIVFYSVNPKDNPEYFL